MCLAELYEDSPGHGGIGGKVIIITRAANKVWGMRVLGSRQGGDMHSLWWC